MKQTLETYIAPENIPRKYGGTLDYEFGMLPVLEPAIRDVFVSAASEPATDLALPAGPLKWKESASGALELLAVGSEGGARRSEVVGRLEGDFGFIHGVSRENTRIDWALEKVRSTTGTATQPAVDGDPEFGRELLEAGSGAQTPASGRIVPVIVGGAAPAAGEAAAQAHAAAETPATTAPAEVASSEAVGVHDAQPVADVEPGDVVQALRQAEEHRAPDEPESKSYVEQAKDAVASAATAAGAAVGQVLVDTGLKAEQHDDEAGPEQGKSENGKLLTEKGAVGVEQQAAQQAVVTS
jgi:hypothetical protein